MELQPLDEPPQLQAQSPSQHDTIFAAHEPNDSDVAFTHRVVAALSYLESLAQMTAGDILAVFQLKFDRARLNNIEQLLSDAGKLDQLFMTEARERLRNDVAKLLLLLIDSNDFAVVYSYIEF